MSSFSPIQGQCRSTELFVGAVDEEFICPIGLGVLPFDQAVSTPCNHVFCSNCIHEALSRKSECPNDHQPLDTLSLSKVPMVLSNLLRKLTAKCDNAPAGCDWTGKWETLTSHLSVCEWVPINCPNQTAGCLFHGVRAKMGDHVRECRFRSIRCMVCKEVLMAKDAESHRLHCKDRPMPCPYAHLGCPATFPASQKHDHVTTNCHFSKFGSLLESLQTKIENLQVRQDECAKSLRDVQFKGWMTECGMQISPPSRDFSRITNHIQLSFSHSLSAPCGLTSDPVSFRTFISDFEKNSVFAFDGRSGKLLFSIPSSGGGGGGSASSDERLIKPVGLGISPAGNICVCDSGNNRLQVFRPDGAFLFSLSDGLNSPVSVAFDYVHKEVHICNCGSHSVSVHRAEGGKLVRGYRTYGNYGTGLGQFDRPTGIAIDSKNGLSYVVDRGNARVSVFRAIDGAFLRSFGADPRGRSEKLGKYVAVHQKSGHVAVSEFGSDRINIFRKKERFLGFRT